MATNFYFQNGIPGGRSSEQLLMEDIIIECLKIYGFDVYYIPRKTVNQDTLFTEDPLNKFEHAYPLEMYLSKVDGFTGDNEFMSKFGVEIRDTATFVVSRRRWDEVVARKGTAQLDTRPAEGDVLYFPLTKAYFEIKLVESLDPFFQVGKLYVYKLECELMRFSSEEFNTGISEIDKQTAEKALDISQYEMLLEDGSKIRLEYYEPSSLISESFNITKIDPTSQNEFYRGLIDILDFTERNPFGEIT